MTDAVETPEPAVPDLQIVSEGASTEDAAAVTAVVGAALGELAAELEMHSGPSQSGWQRSQRPIRGTVAPGAGAWRSFSG